MTTALHSQQNSQAPGAGIVAAAAQLCQQLSGMREQQGAMESLETRLNNSHCSDKENEQMREKALQREILDKLKHDTTSLPSTQYQAEQWLTYHKLRASAMSDSALASQHAAAAELLRREALLSMHARQGKMDCFNPLAILNPPAGLLNSSTESQAMSGHSQASNSPSRSSQSPDEADEGDVKVEMMSPNVPPTNGGQWTYEEQFKQLYELDTDPDRKAFLDDLFTFMQRRGTPVNRIPIMAKQTLDMYKLFKLVVSKGGLVEVINKKLWREITKGLSLPSSITSAAFTLRTQYMKYLYTYECDKYAFSSPTELQSAIDGNRREGRRPGYGYDMPSPSMPPFYGQQGFPNGNPFFNPLVNNPMASLLSSQLQGAYINGSPIPGGPPVNHPRLSAPITPSSCSAPIGERNQSPIDVSSPQTSIQPNRQSPRRRSRSPDIVQTHADTPSPKRSRPDHHLLLTQSPSAQNQLNTGHREAGAARDRLDKCPITSISKQPSPMSEEERTKPLISNNNPLLEINNQNGPTAHVSMDSVTVCMEVNGILYKGTLYAKKDDQH